MKRIAKIAIVVILSPLILVSYTVLAALAWAFDNE